MLVISVEKQEEGFIRIVRSSEILKILRTKNSELNFRKPWTSNSLKNKR
jgi:hypothetical protein